MITHFITDTDQRRHQAEKKQYDKIQNYKYKTDAALHFGIPQINVHYFLLIVLSLSFGHSGFNFQYNNKTLLNFSNFSGKIMLRLVTRAISYLQFGESLLYMKGLTVNCNKSTISLYFLFCIFLVWIWVLCHILVQHVISFFLILFSSYV